MKPYEDELSLYKDVMTRLYKLLKRITDEVMECHDKGARVPYNTVINLQDTVACMKRYSIPDGKEKWKK